MFEACGEAIVRAGCDILGELSTGAEHRAFPERMKHKVVRKSVSLPATVAPQVRTMAKTRRLSANRMLVELIENGIETEKRKQREFFGLAERFATPPTRKRSNGWATKRAGWFSAADAKDRDRTISRRVCAST
jgi:N6-adenosine-specific RNA methylase IME4